MILVNFYYHSLVQLTLVIVTKILNEQQRNQKTITESVYPLFIFEEIDTRV